MKKTAIIVLALLLFTGGIAVGSSINGDYEGFPIVNVVIDGQPVTGDVPAINFYGRTMVPLRVISESLGAAVEWDEVTMTASVTSPEPAVIEAKPTITKAETTTNTTDATETTTIGANSETVTTDNTSSAATEQSVEAPPISNNNPDKTQDAPEDQVKGGVPKDYK